MPFPLAKRGLCTVKIDPLELVLGLLEKDQVEAPLCVRQPQPGVIWIGQQGGEG